MTTKQYNTPMLQIVGISKNDIIVTSPLSIGGDLTTQEATDGFIFAGSADRFHDFDAGY